MARSTPHVVGLRSDVLTVPTTCPFCACGCGLYLLAKQGELIGVAPSESHPVSAGRLCARGWNAHEAPLWGTRLTQPLVNRTGKLQPVSWAEALDWVAESFQSLIATGKSVGVLGSARATNEENYLAGKLARAYLRTNNLDFSYHPVCGPLLRGIEDVCGSSFPSVSLRDIESSQTILLIEGDLAYTHPQVALSVLRAVEKGARLITLGCVRTQLARLASLHLQVAPGSESVAINALLAGVLNSPSMELSSVALGSEGLEMLRKGMASVSVTEEARQV